MMRRLSSVALVTGVLVVAANAHAACSRCEAIKNVTDAAVVTGTGKEPSIEDVSSAIKLAGAALGWQVRDAGPGKLIAVLYIRTHTAEVEIPFSTQRYSIQYKSSMNLNEEGGQIHRNYNGWIYNFSQGVNTRLSNL